MHVTACLAGQKVDVEVGESCRTLQALRESIVVALPQLCVEGFDVSVGGRALDDDEEIVSLQESVCLDVVPNTRVLSVLALREAGREVSEEGLLCAAEDGDVALVMLYLDAGVPLDCIDDDENTPLHLACGLGHAEVARLLLDRKSTAVQMKNDGGETPLFLSCCGGHVEITTMLLDRGTSAIDSRNVFGETPLHCCCLGGHAENARLLLDRGSAGMDKKDMCGESPLVGACRRGYLSVVSLLLDRGCTPVDVARCTSHNLSPEVLELLSQRGYNVDRKKK